MFNNPFESFHDTIAEAKADREQLDRLLTVSTPRERLLLLLVFLVFVSLFVWIVFGQLDRNIAAQGTLIEHTTTSDQTQNVVRIDVWLSAEHSPKIKVGMPIMIKSAGPQKDRKTIRGDIRSILALNLSQELMIAGPASLTAKRLEVNIEPAIDVPSLVGEKCAVNIQLGRQSPLTLVRETLF